MSDQPTPGPRRAEPLETDRLHLRALQADDAEAIHAYMSRDDVCRWIPHEVGDLTRSRERNERRMATSWDLAAASRQVDWAVVLRDCGTVIGDVTLFSSEEPVHQQGELGYCFHPDHAGHGYATEAVVAALDWSFANLPLHRICARIDAENEASWRLMERIGARREAHLIGNEWFKGRWSVEYDYAILAQEWPRLRAKHP